MVEGAVDGHLGETATHLALHDLAFLHAHLLFEQVARAEQHNAWRTHFPQPELKPMSPLRRLQLRPGVSNQPVVSHQHV